MNSAEGGHDVHGHNPYLAHHFDTPEQQFESGKQGMWLFLATEVLLFGGLFCFYSVYRRLHPEIFAWGHEFLVRKWGAINTCVLIFSSLTMAWGVRCAQLGQTRRLVALLTVTLLCGAAFMCVKYVEYKAKWEHGLLWAGAFNPHLEGNEGGEGHEPASAASHSMESGGAAGHDVGSASAPVSMESAAGPAHGAPASGTASDPASAAASPPSEETSNIKPAAIGPLGTVPREDRHGSLSKESKDAPHNARVFFSIYFAMTGLHGLHVLIGMIAIGWILIRAIRGEFNGENFMAVDLVGLYWHLVDLIWIYLFPLLYLIH